MTAILSPSRRCLIGFSVYFALVSLVLLCLFLEVKIDGIGSPIALVIIIPYLQPISQFYESVVNAIHYRIFDKGMSDNLSYGCLFLFIVLFYIVYFTSWYFKRRKDEKNEKHHN